MTRTPIRSSILALVLGATALVAITSVPSVASAEVDSASRSAARKLGYEGVKAYQAEDYEKATERLERAYKVLKAPSLALWSARALEKNGKLVEASERYLEATRLAIEAGGDPKVQEKAKADAKKERAAVDARIPTVIVLIEGADPEEVEVTIDGVVVSAALFGAGRPTNPGDIVVEAKLGSRVVKGTVELEEAEEKSITLSFQTAEAAVAVPPPEDSAEASEEEPAAEDDKAPPAEPKDSGTGPDWQRIGGWTSIGLGGASLVLGGVMAGLAVQTEEDLTDAGCVDGSCPPAAQGTIDDYDTYRMVSTVGFIAGGVLAASGVTLLLTAPNKENTAYVSPYLAGTSFGLKGAF